MGLRTVSVRSTCIRHQCLSNQWCRHPTLDVTARKTVWILVEWWNAQSYPMVLTNNLKVHAGNICDFTYDQLIRLLTFSQGYCKGPSLITDVKLPSAMPKLHSLVAYPAFIHGLIEPLAQIYRWRWLRSTAYAMLSGYFDSQSSKNKSNFYMTN